MHSPTLGSAFISEDVSSSSEQEPKKLKAAWDSAVQVSWRMEWIWDEVGHGGCILLAEFTFLEVTSIMYKVLIIFRPGLF